MIVYLHPPSTAAHKQPMAFNFNDDLVAQLVEHLPFKERVLGSSPSQVTRFAENRFGENLPAAGRVYAERSRSEPQPGHKTKYRSYGTFLFYSTFTFLPGCWNW